MEIRHSGTLQTVLGCPVLGSERRRRRRRKRKRSEVAREISKKLRKINTVHPEGGGGGGGGGGGEGGGGGGG